MIKYFYDSKFIANNELIFYIYLALIIIMIALTIVFGYKEIKKNEVK